MKKRFYNVISIFLVAIFLIQMSYASKSFAIERESENDLEIDDYVTNQKDALDAYSSMIEGIKAGELDESIYAGAYINGVKLVIMLTDLTDEIKNDYLSIIKNPNVVDFEQAKYSLKYLNEQLNETVNMLSSYPITEYGFYESKNKAFIKIDEDYYNRFMSEGSILYSEYDTPIIFEPGKYYDTGATGENFGENNFEERYSSSAVKDIMGGMTLYSNSGYSTIGFCGYYGIMDAILVAGHAVSEGEKTEYGTVIQRCYGDKKYGDYAIIFVDSNYRITNEIVNNTWGSLEVITVYSSVPEGTSIHMYGYVTKGLTATVTATNVSMPSYVDVNVQIVTKGLTKAKCDYLLSQPGDSGGPVYVPLGNSKVAACGIHKGGNEYDSIFFVPFEYIPALFTPKTGPA